MHEGRTSAPSRLDERDLPHAGLWCEAALREGAFELDAAFDVAPGETVTLVGPSGAGKTTCLHVIAGLVAPERARITLGGETLCDTAAGIERPPHRRRLGVLFQDDALFPHLSVRGNVAFGSRARGTGDAKREAERWLERMGIAREAERSIASLSGGERRRVALARALASGALALLLDEPFGGLDVATRGVVRGELRAFLSAIPLPTLMVTHDPLEARMFGNRIAVLERGRITQFGPHSELARQPRTSFVAQLTGLNLFRASLEPGSGLRAARGAALTFHVLAEDLGGEVWLAFEPAEVTLATEAHSDSAQNHFRGIVRELLPLADRVRVVLDAGALLAAEVTSEAAASLALAPGRTVWASVKATAIRVYC